MPRRFLTIVFAGVALAAICAPAQAGKGQLSVFQDDALLRGSGDATRAQTLDEIDALGADVVKVLVNWRMIAPASKPDGFDAADPASYSADAWAPYDDLVRQTRSRGMRVYFALGGLAPDWASGNSRVAGSARPSPGAFRKFVKAVGTRYSGSYAVGAGSTPAPAPPEDPEMPLPLPLQAGVAQAGTTLPRVGLYSVWNEPNLGNWLHPQHKNGVPVRASPLPEADQGRKGRAVGQRPQERHDADRRARARSAQPATASGRSSSCARWPA